jgi:DNA-binding NarL/FixJ family response regulator
MAWQLHQRPAMELCHETLVPNSNNSWASTSQRPVTTDDLTIRVWLVDDDDALRELLADLLNRHARLFCPRQFASAESLLEALGRETPPDVLLLDINLPGQNGLDAIGPIKAVAPSVRILMHTTFFDSLDERRAFEAGATGFLLKSYDLPQIVRSIQTACDCPDSARLFSNSALVRNPEPRRHCPARQTSPGPAIRGAKPVRLLRALLAMLSL